MSEFFTLTLIGLLMTISPGPDFAIVTKLSVGSGRLAGIGAAFGISVACLCHVTLNLFGIGVIIAGSPTAFTVMKILGAAYLLYIGVKGVFAKPIKISADDIHLPTFEQKTKSLARKGFYSGFLTNVLNPKAFLFFLSFFSVLISPGTAIELQALYGFWLSFMAAFWFTLVAIFFTNPVISNRLNASKHWIERIAGGALMILGVRLLGASAII